MEKRNRGYFAAGGILLAAALGLLAVSRQFYGFADWYAHGIYPLLVGSIGRFFGLFPFSVSEWGLYGLVLGTLAYGWRFLRQPFRLLSRLVFGCGVLLFLYVCCCGVNYQASSFSHYAGLETGEYSLEELRALCFFLTEQVNKTVEETKREELSYEENKAEWQREGRAAMKQVGERFPALAGYSPLPKEVAVSWILSVQQLSGIYSPFTIEANYNGDMTDYNIPHTICHELSHLHGFMREDEANFIGYLACVFSENPGFRYSGYLTGWVYAGNALATQDMETYRQLSDGLCKQARDDLQRNNAFWGKYDTKIAEASVRLNDAYLKANRQEEGVRSYGRMVDLMLAYERSRLKIGDRREGE